MSETKSLPVLFDFWAPWCRPCVAMQPTLDFLGEKLRDRVKIQKVNVDEQPDLAVQYGVRSVPTLVLADAGVEKLRIVGARPAASLELEVLGALSD